MIVRSPRYESEPLTIYLPDEVVGILSEHLRQHTPTRRAVTVAVQRGRQAVARQPRRLPLALHPHRRRSQLQAPRTAALLRQRPHRRWVRRGHRPAGDGSRLGRHDVEHLRAPLADRRGQDPRRCVRDGPSRPPIATGSRSVESIARSGSFRCRAVLPFSTTRSSADGDTRGSVERSPVAPASGRRMALAPRSTPRQPRHGSS